MNVAIVALFTGRVQPLGDPPVPSGIVKQPRAGPVRLSVRGFDGDAQGDTVHHGGAEKAVHHYAAEHYAAWRARWPDSPVPLAPGAFGESVATCGMTEETVCIGDVYRVGSALLQVSQGRQPCWKLNRRFDRLDAALAMQRSGATGWYYRVLEEGVIAAGDEFVLLERPCPDWPLDRLIRALFPADPEAPQPTGEWREAAGLAPLAPNWRTAFARRVETGCIEDWSRRLAEP